MRGRYTDVHVRGVTVGVHLQNLHALILALLSIPLNRSPVEFFNFMSVWIEQHNFSWTPGAREGSKPLGNDGKLATDILAVIRHSMPDLLKVVDCSEAIALPQEQRCAREQHLLEVQLYLWFSCG